MSDLPEFGVAIIGAGPSGTGPFVCAAQNGHLDDFLNQGIALIDQSPVIGSGRIGEYFLHSNSVGGAFIDCLEHPRCESLLGHLRELEPYPSIAPQRGERIPLAWVGKLLGNIGSVIGAKLEAHHKCAVFKSMQAQCLRLDNGFVRVGLARSKSAEETGDALEIRARTVVLALGGEQKRCVVMESEVVPGVRIGDLDPTKVFLSDHLMRSAGFDRMIQQIRREPEPRVVLLGGSHSAFGTAWHLVNEDTGCDFGPGSISILHRDPVRVRYRTREEAQADNFEFTEDDVCPRTGQINRGGGLIGRETEMWRAVTGRGKQEARVALHHLGKWSHKPEEMRQLLGSASAVVTCFGYHANTIPIYDGSGTELPLRGQGGGDLVNSEMQVTLSDGTPIDNVFGVGLCSGFRAANLDELEPSFTGHANGVWLYQNTIANHLLRRLYDQLGVLGASIGESDEPGVFWTFDDLPPSSKSKAKKR